MAGAGCASVTAPLLSKLFTRFDGSMSKNILIVAGDGIGPEVMGEMERVITWFNENRGMDFAVENELVGGCCYDAHGVAVTDETVAKAKAADAV